MTSEMYGPKMESGRWTETAPENNDDLGVRNPAWCKFNPIASTCRKPPCLDAQPKSSKCFVKIAGSRYNGSFLLNVDEGLDDTIYHTMRDIEVALENQVDPLGKPRVSPKKCLSSVFKCFGASETNAKLFCNKKKKKYTKPIGSSLEATLKQSDIGPLTTTLQTNSSHHISENSNQTVIRDVVDVFQTTLDQFRIENMNPSKPLTPYEPSHSHDRAKMNQNITGLTKPSSEQAKKVSFIRFSQEEVVIIQPPTPSNDSQELEVGIEVKPKSAAVNVGQSIKLAKDKVLIGVQDGQGVLQISEGTPKRTLQMVLEEDVNGKPSMKLCFNEETQIDQKAMQKNNAKIQCGDISDTSSSTNNIYTVSDESSFSCQNPYKEPGRSVESQVSWARLKDANQTNENTSRFKTESTQCDYIREISSANYCLSGVKPNLQTSDAKVANGNDDFKQRRIVKPLFQGDYEVSDYRNVRKDRLPYIVHKLYEPMSLNCCTSDKSFSNCKVMKSAQTCMKERKTEKVQPSKSIEFSSDHSSSNQSTKISARSSKPLGKKDAEFRKILMEDFEKVLQNMCGSSYLYHSPEGSLPKPAQYRNIVKPNKSSSFPMSFDQWSQTDHHQCFQTGQGDIIGKCYKGTKSIEEPNNYCFSSNVIRGGKQTKSCASQSGDGTSIIESSAEDELISDDSSDGPTLNQCSMIEPPANKLMKSNKFCNLINGKAKSSVGKKIFAAIETSTVDSDLFGLVKKADSFLNPPRRDKSNLLRRKGCHTSVVNMALCGVPIELTLPESIEKDEEVIHDRFLAAQVEDQRKEPCLVEHRLNSISSITIKSKSCQDLSTAPSYVDVNRGWPKRISTSRQGMKLRYPHMTATDFHRASTVNFFLHFSEGNITDEHPAGNITSFKKRCPLPSAIRQLLLPRQMSAGLLGHSYESNFCCNNVNAKERWNHETSIQIQNETFVLNETAESITSLAVRKTLLKKTFSAMKTAKVTMGKTFSGILRKLSFSEAKKKKDTVINESSVYVAIPLEKKSENILYCTKPQ